MRIFFALLCGLLAACSSTPTSPTTSAAPPATGPETTAPQAQATPAPALSADHLPTTEVQAILPSKIHHLRSGGVSMVLFVCDDRRVRFSLADQAKGPGTQWKNAQAAAKAKGAVAAINGGFFTPEGTPLGLVVENKKPFGHWNRSSSLTSGVFFVQEGKPHLERSSSPSPPAATEYLLQTGPFLLEKKSVISGLSNKEARPRSFLLWDGRHHWAIGYANSATLATLAKALAQQAVPNFKIQSALNLDGGSSSQLWIGPEVKGGPQWHRPLWTKPVRNFVLVHKNS